MIMQFHGIRNNREILQNSQSTNDTITDPNPPLCLLVDNAAVDAIDKYLNECLLEFDAWREVSANTNFD